MTAEHKPNLRWLLGAGFSQGLEIPGTIAVVRSSMHICATIRRADTHLRDRLAVRFGDDYNFRGSRRGARGLRTLRQPRLPAGSTYVQSSLRYRPFVADSMSRSRREMYESLMWTWSNQISADWKTLAPRVAIDDARSCLARAMRENQLDIATLNYDEIVENLLPNTNDGFEGAGDLLTFNSATFLVADTRPKIAHLHGSLRYGLQSRGNFKIRRGFVVKRLALWHPRADRNVVRRLDHRAR